MQEFEEVDDTVVVFVMGIEGLLLFLLIQINVQIFANSLEFFCTDSAVGVFVVILEVSDQSVLLLEVKDFLEFEGNNELVSRFNHLIVFFCKIFYNY